MEIIEGHMMPDHVHLLVAIPSKLSVSSFMGYLKGKSALLIYFDKLYAVMDQTEKRQFVETLIDEIQIYEERKPNGQWLKSIKFKLPIIEENFEMRLDDDMQDDFCILYRNW